eukprot:1654721-Rhodomonas_salina.1
MQEGAHSMRKHYEAVRPTGDANRRAIILARSQRRRVLVLISTVAACAAVAALAHWDERNHSTNALVESADTIGTPAAIANHATTTKLQSVDPGPDGTVDINTEDAANGAGDGGSGTQAQAKKCDEACVAQRQATAAKMKALQVRSAPAR